MHAMNPRLTEHEVSRTKVEQSFAESSGDMEGHKAAIARLSLHCPQEGQPAAHETLVWQARRTTVGRAGQCALQVESPLASRCHLLIQYDTQNDCMWLSDTSSFGSLVLEVSKGLHCRCSMGWVNSD